MNRFSGRTKRRLGMAHIHQAGRRPEFKRLIWEKAPGRCWFCGEGLHYDAGTVDHLTPVKLGGETSYSNCVVACKICNNAKGHHSLGAYRHMVGVAKFYGEK